MSRPTKGFEDAYRGMGLGEPSPNGRGRAPNDKVGGHALPEIRVNNRHLRDVTDETLRALVERNSPPTIFVRSGALARIVEDESGTPRIQTLTDDHLRGRMARVADFVRVTESGKTLVNPPDVVVKDVQALGSWPLPTLEGLVESPILRPDGSICDEPGYDSRTRLIYHPMPGFRPPKIPTEPTREEVEDALALVAEAIGQFPYENESSAANALGLLLTLISRQAIGGPVPLGLIDKPQAGTGGSLLAEAAAMIGTGRQAEMLGAPRDDEEWRKQITAKLSSGASTVVIDNVDGSLYAPSLARALTANTWSDRILGRSETVNLQQRATWLATGNNVILRGDLPRRCYWIRLDAQQSRPWQRDGFKHPDLIRWITENRGELVGALLTIARAWFAAGKPKAKGLPRLGSFEAWSETIGGMIAHARVPGFLGNLDALYVKADEGGAEWEAFLSAWREAFGGEPTTVKVLTDRIKRDDRLRWVVPPDLLPDLERNEGSFVRKLGNALSARVGRRYGEEEELYVERAGTLHKTALWKVSKGSPEGPPGGGFGGLGGLFLTPREEKSGKVPPAGPEINPRDPQTPTDAVPTNSAHPGAGMGGNGHDRKALEALRHGKGPRKALESHKTKGTPFEQVVRSVMNYLGRRHDSLDEWEPSVMHAADVLGRGDDVEVF